jgi:23S rRNA pseudouridine1911/1915/1917 synthase
MSRRPPTNPSILPDVACIPHPCIDWREFHVPRNFPHLKRLDKYLFHRLGHYTRSTIQNWIRRGAVRVNGKPCKSSREIHKNDRIELAIPMESEGVPFPEPIPLEILFEDEHLLAINKPVGMVVHPARGHHRGTLVNALLYHCKSFLSSLNGEDRPGIVHRLDRNTSGVILAAKTDQAHAELGKQFEYRRVRKEYLALVHGKIDPPSGEIHLPLGRHRKDPHRMSVRHDGGKRAITAYETREFFSSPEAPVGQDSSFSWLLLRPHTGRTHQIRIHLASIRHPIVGDPTYGGARSLLGPDAPPLLQRQALHAYRIRIRHPIHGEELTFTADLPEDLQRTLRTLRSGAPTTAEH